MSNTPCPRCGNQNPADIAHDALDYNPETGAFTWKVKASSRAPAGAIAGTVKRNRNVAYRIISCGGNRLYAHRLAWMLHHGPIPDGMVIDHVNGNGLDNRITNLRLCTQAENSRNQSARTKKQYTPKGVSFDKSRDKWLAQIKKDYRRIYLGRFKTVEEAHSAYLKASKELFGEYSRS